MTNTDIETFILSDDESLFYTISQWELEEHKQEIFNLCFKHDAKKCIEEFIATFGLDIDMLIKNNNLTSQDFEEIYSKDIDSILDGDFDRADKLSLSLQYKNIPAFNYFANLELDYWDVVGFNKQQAGDKDQSFIDRTLAFFAMSFNNLEVIEKVFHLYNEKLKQIEINITPVKEDVVLHGCDEDINTLDELLFYQHLLYKGHKQLEEFIASAKQIAA